MAKRKAHRAAQEYHRRRSEPGASPGTLAADPDAQKPVIDVICFGGEQLIERRLEKIDEVDALVGKFNVLWLNICGLGDVNTIQHVGRLFHLHVLALEDVVSVHQRPKVDVYPDNLYVVLREIEVSGQELTTDQVSLFFGKNFVVTFQERAGDCFDPVRRRIRNPLGRVRARAADYLAYALIDAVIDHYFPVLEHFGDRIEKLHDRALVDQGSELLSQIQYARRDAVTLRRMIWPMRDQLNTLLRDESRMFHPDTLPFLRDCYDHVAQAIDVVESYRELCSNLMDIYVSMTSQRLNEVMRVLTVISTIFIPLTFVVGVYGMNFDTDVSPWNMPELKWYWGYPLVWGLMFAIALGLMGFFYRKGWLRAESSMSQNRSSETTANIL